MSEPIGGVTGVSALNDLLDGYRVPPGSRATVLEAVTAVQAEGVTVVGRVVGAEVELSPADGSAAASVGPSRLTLTLERRPAVRVAQQYEFCRLDDDETERGAAARVQLSMEQWAVQQHAVVVRNLVVAALRAALPRPEPVAPARAVGGRTAAPRATGRTSRSERASRAAKAAAAAAPPPPKPAVCPTHFVQLVNGRCDYCDD